MAKIIEVDGKRYRVVPFPKTSEFLDNYAVACAAREESFREPTRKLPEPDSLTNEQTCTQCGETGHNKRTCDA